MELTGHRTYKAVIVDFLALVAKPFDVKPSILKDLYVTQGLSASQIAERLGCSRPAIMERLARQKLSRPKKGSLTNPKNYRHHEPPYGYKVRDGQLVLNSTEIRICRLIVNLRGRRGKTLAQVAAELSKRGHKNRRGKTDWHHQTVGNIFKRWNGKL